MAVGYCFLHTKGLCHALCHDKISCLTGSDIGSHLKRILKDDKSGEASRLDRSVRASWHFTVVYRIHYYESTMQLIYLEKNIIELNCEIGFLLYEDKLT